MWIRRLVSGRTTLLALLVLVGMVLLVGTLANHSRVVADDGADRVLRPMGPENQVTWPDDSPIRISGGGGNDGGKESTTKNGGGGAADRERKPARPECCSQPTGR